MNNSSNDGHNGLATTPQEEMLLIHLAAGLLTVLVASAGVFWLKGATWLVEHRILVSASAHPLIAVPGAAGAGLDLPRVAIAAAAVIAVIAWAASAVRRSWSTREAAE